MTARRWLLLLLACVLVIAAIVAANMVREPYRSWTQDDARLDSSQYGLFLGLSEFYKKNRPQMKQEVWRYANDKQPQWGAQHNHLLFIEDSEGMSQTQFEQILSWAEQGNHVVLPLPLPAADSDDDAADYEAAEYDDEDLQDAFASADIAKWAGITYVQPKKAAATASAKASCKREVDAIQEADRQIADKPLSPNPEYQQDVLNRCVNAIAEIRLPEGKTLHFLGDEYRPFFRIAPSPRVLWQSQSVGGSQIARLRYGKGSIVVTTVPKAFGNPGNPSYPNTDLNRADHAYLAAYLAQDKQAVWFVGRFSAPLPKTPPLWQKLWQLSPWFCIGLILLTGCVLWNALPRHGVMRRLNRHQNRQLTPYLHAQGEFLWHKQDRRHVLQQLRSQLWQQWQQRIPDLPLLPREEQLNAVARCYPAPRDAIVLWLEPLPAKPTAKQWLTLLHAHQLIRNAV